MNARTRIRPTTMNDIKENAACSLEKKMINDLSDECNQAAQSVQNCVDFALDTYMQYVAYSSAEISRLLDIVHEQRKEIELLKEQLQKMDGEC